MSKITQEYYEASIKRIQGWIASGGPDYIAIHMELKTFYDLGFRDGYQAGIDRYGTNPAAEIQKSYLEAREDRDGMTDETHSHPPGHPMDPNAGKEDK